MFVEVPGAAEAAVMAMSLYCAVADDLMGTANLASPHALHLHALAQGLHITCTLAAARWKEYMQVIACLVHDRCCQKVMSFTILWTACHDAMMPQYTCAAATAAVTAMPSYLRFT